MKKVTIVGSYETDLNLALKWLRLNKAVKAVGQINKVGNVYTVVVKTRSKEKVKSLVKDRFGYFIKVV